MRKGWQFITRSKRRKIGATLLVMGLLAGGAIAYYMATVTGTQSGSAPLATTASNIDVSNNMTVTLPTGLSPGQSGPASVTVQNTTTHPMTISSVTPAGVTTSTGSCAPSWFTQSTGNGTTMPVVIAPSTTSTVWTGTVTFTNVGGDQSGCEGASINESFTVGGTGAQ